MNFNRIILGGRLTCDPVLRNLPNGTAVVDFGLAVNRKWTPQGGSEREETCFVDVTAFGRTAEVLNQWARKGRSLLVEGRLKHDTWTDKAGGKRSKHSVVVDGFQFVGGRGADEQAPAAAAPAPPVPAVPAALDPYMPAAAAAVPAAAPVRPVPYVLHDTPGAPSGEQIPF